MSISLNNGPISDRAFYALSEPEKKDVYQKANESHDVELVRRLNALGMKWRVLEGSGPSIISDFMDIATKHDLILSFFKELRDTSRLLTKEEFQSLSAKSWRMKERSDIERILGRDYLLKKIKENNLKTIKVPIKIAVVEAADSLTVLGYHHSTNLYTFRSDQIKVYAEEITREERKLSRDEIDELIQVIATSNFLDLWPANIILAKDAIYFIDTEFKSFSGSIDWGNLSRFESLIKKCDLMYFRKRVEGKMKEPGTTETMSRYGALAKILSLYKKLPKEQQEQEKQAIEELERECSRLAYVGNKKAGSSWLRPNRFSFRMSEILPEVGIK